jgi:hypothetical protein
MQMTRRSTKRERWLLVYGLRKFRVPKQQERALAEVILDGIAPMLNVTFSTRTFALLLTLLRSNRFCMLCFSRNKFPKRTRIAQVFR